MSDGCQSKNIDQPTKRLVPAIWGFSWHLGLQLLASEIPHYSSWQVSWWMILVLWHPLDLTPFAILLMSGDIIWMSRNNSMCWQVDKLAWVDAVGFCLGPIVKKKACAESKLFEELITHFPGAQLNTQSLWKQNLGSATSTFVRTVARGEWEFNYFC